MSKTNIEKQMIKWKWTSCTGLNVNGLSSPIKDTDWLDHANPGP